MAHVTLILPPGLPGTTPNHEGASGLGAVAFGVDGFRYPPHTLATVAATLREAGYMVTVCDAVALEYDIAHCVRDVLAGQPDIIGVFVSWATRETDQRFIAALREGATRSVPIIALGISVRLMPAYLDAADYLLSGEPELSFPILCDHVTGKKGSLPRVVSPADLAVPGYGAQGLIENLDILPNPAWDLLPIEHYSHLTVLSSRGCEEACSWCPYVVAQGRRFRACSPARVAAELRELVQRYRPRRIVFRDPAFAHDPDRVESICRRILADSTFRPGKNLVWECESHPEHFDRPLLHLMSLAGCMGIKVGLETVEADVLSREGRTRQNVKGYLAHVSELAYACAHEDIALRLFLLVGLSNQTIAGAQETAAFVRSLKPASVSVKVLEHYPELRLSAAPTLSQAEIEAQMALLGAQAPFPQRRPSRLRDAYWELERFLWRKFASSAWGARRCRLW